MVKSERVFFDFKAFSKLSLVLVDQGDVLPVSSLHHLSVCAVSSLPLLIFLLLSFPVYECMKRIMT